jgi:hypothetical protein
VGDIVGEFVGLIVGDNVGLFVGLIVYHTEKIGMRKLVTTRKGARASCKEHVNLQGKGLARG